MRRCILPFIGILSILSVATSGHSADDPARISNEGAPTLLLPYFEVQLPSERGGRLSGRTTIFTIGSAFSGAELARVTLWTDLGIPVFAFHVYLTGFDVQTIDIREIIEGRLPQTASTGQDPGDTISNHGSISQDINFISCNGFLPPAPLDAATIDHLRAAFTGAQSPLLGGCVGLDHGEKKPLARGFVTVDEVITCSALLPSDSGYYAELHNQQRPMWGQYFLVDQKPGGTRTAKGDAMVHIRAGAIVGGGATDPQITTPGEYTFYSRFNGSAATDQRQPLATKFIARYSVIPRDRLFSKGTSLIVWRDPKVSTVAAFPCGTTPSWFPLGQEEIIAFNDEEDPVAITSSPFGAATQLVTMNGPALPLPFETGALYMNLNTLVADAPATPTEDPAAAQAWVTAVYDGKRSSNLVRAIALDSATEVSHFNYVP
jgi:hypothetical protein